MEDYLDMMKVGKTRLLLCFVAILTIAAFAATTANAGLFKSRKSHKGSKVVIVRQTIVIFPLDQSPDAKVPEKFGSDIASYLRTTLSGKPEYWPIIYSDNLAPIKRAKDDSSLKTQDLTPPYSEDKAKSLRLAQALAADCYLVGSVDDFQFDKAKKVAQLTLSAELINAKTGKVMQQFTVGGKADESSKATEEDEMRAVAAGKAVEALKEKLIAAVTPEPAPAKK